MMAPLILTCGVAANAQPANTVTIKFDDGDGISGELLEASDTSLRLNTLSGAITIPKVGVTCIGAACPDDIRLDVTEAPVLLTAHDGTTRIGGALLGVENGQYVLATDLGEIRVDLTAATCEGEACPDQPEPPQFGGLVTLTNGTTSVEGTLTGFDDEGYLVEVKGLGALRVAKDFTCAGEGCPQL